MGTELSGLTTREAALCGDAFRLLVERINRLEMVEKAAKDLVAYYKKSLDVGPGAHPKKETKLWIALKAAIERANLP
jgi:hypothetical protein